MYWIAMLMAALAAAPARAGKVTMYTDDTHAVKVKRGKLDCTIHKNKRSSLRLGFKMSVAFAAKVGPEVTWGKETGIAWNGMSQELIRRYEELCDAHNKGHLTVAEYNRRYEKLEGLFEHAVELKQEIEENVYKRSEKAFDDLDEESAKYNVDGTPKDDLKVEMTKKLKKYSKDIVRLADEVRGDEDADPAAKVERTAAKPQAKEASESAAAAVLESETGE